MVTYVSTNFKETFLFSTLSLANEHAKENAGYVVKTFMDVGGARRFKSCFSEREKTTTTKLKTVSTLRRQNMSA